MTDVSTVTAGPAPRAAPPISIPPFTNVPSPGSPIRSDWAQQVTQYVVHAFTDITQRDTWTGPPDGARCYVASTKRDYRRVAGAWETIPISGAGQAAVTGDGSGNAGFTFSRAFPAAPTGIIIVCLDYANVGCIPFNLTATGCSVGLRRPADNSPVGGIAVSIGYVATLM